MDHLPVAAQRERGQRRLSVVREGVAGKAKLGFQVGRIVVDLGHDLRAVRRAEVVVGDREVVQIVDDEMVAVVGEHVPIESRVVDARIEISALKPVRDRVVPHLEIVGIGTVGGDDAVLERLGGGVVVWSMIEFFTVTLASEPSRNTPERWKP